MSTLKFNNDLELGSQELYRLVDFLDTTGFRKNIIDNTVSFGLVKSDRDIPFDNGKVLVGSTLNVDDIIFNTIKVNAVNAIDKDGLFISKAITPALLIPDDGQWHWVRTSYNINNNEIGTFSISIDGTLTGVGSQLTAVLRGMPTYPSRVRFTNSVNNISEYDILEVSSDTSAILNGTSFFAETGLTMAVVGTFTPGVAVPNNNKLIYNYDSATVEVVPEVTLNTPPIAGYVQDKTFYLARVSIINGLLVIQDKRTNYWEEKGADITTKIDRVNNPVVGVESIQFQHTFSPQDKNAVNMYWGMRSSNWSVDSTQRVLTIQTGLGGILKSVNDTTTGMFNNWRVYTSNGKYSRIYNSVKQGQTINLYLDALDVNNYSSDGGTTWLAQQVYVVPDTEEVEFLFVPVTTTQQSNELKFTFPVNSIIGRCELTAYNDPQAQYYAYYRYKTDKEFTTYSNINIDTVGYLNEASFDVNGNANASPQRIPVDSTSVITLTISPNAFKNFVGNIDKGDLIGVQNYTTFDESTYDLIVGTTKNYIHIKGSPSLTEDITLNLSSVGAVEGSKFTIHFDCTNISLNGSGIYIVQDSIRLKAIEQQEVWTMQNQEKGIAFNCTFDGGNWVIYQNYNLGRPYELIDVDGTPNQLFDPTTGLGKITGLYGYAICNGTITSYGSVPVPNLSNSFIMGVSNTHAVGTIGGEETHTLTIAEMPAHTHGIALKSNLADAGGSIGGQSVPDSSSTSSTGGGLAHNNLPPYYVAIKAKKLF